jgi:hypothetical protein
MRLRLALPLLAAIVAGGCSSSPTTPAAMCAGPKPVSDAAHDGRHIVNASRADACNDVVIYVGS